MADELSNMMNDDRNHEPRTGLGGVPPNPKMKLTFEEEMKY